MDDIEAAMETDGGDAPAQPEKKYLIDTVYMKHPRKNMNMVSFLKDGMSEWFFGPKGLSVMLSWISCLKSPLLCYVKNPFECQKQCIEK